MKNPQISWENDYDSCCFVVKDPPRMSTQVFDNGNAQPGWMFLAFPFETPRKVPFVLPKMAW